MLDLQTKQLNTTLTGTVLRIERGSVYDGDGFRTVIFLKGCPLHCWWCSTPESQSPKIQQAGTTTYGQVMSVEAVMKEIRKDSCCYFQSGGGVTLSGGEILAQPRFTRQILKTAWSECINTAVETTFYTEWSELATILPYVNTAFVDLKMITPELHQKYVGGDNQIVMNNLLHTNEIEDDLDLIVRTPIIPGINDNETELAGIGKFCAQLKHLKHVQLLPYHRLGTATYQKLGRPYPLADVMPPSAEQMAKYQAIVGQYVTAIV